MASSQKIVVVGAGPVGALAAIYAAQRGHQVEVYELRDDLRDPSTTPLNFTRSINLALSVRGITAMSQAHREGLLESILANTIPMRGRMIHSRQGEEGQDYDVHGRAILAADRAKLNMRLLDELDAMPNVRVFFRHKLLRADFVQRKASFEMRGPSKGQVDVDFDFLIGADGAHSLVRYQLMRYTRIDYQQEYIDTLWCEFRIDPVENGRYGRFAISPHHLHIWPGKQFMFIAIPSEDGSFTCTLFLPSKEFSELERHPASLPAFFDQHFPGVTDYISPAALLKSFETNPHLPLISVKCRPYHYADAGVIVGDAAHAMVPFYGQGMNAGLEDVRVLFSILDKHTDRAAALEEYSAFRGPDAAAINDMALQNYIEMRESVTSPIYRMRKVFEEFLSVNLPWLGWQTKYSRVSFGTERYSSVVAQSERQGNILAGGLALAVAAPVVGLLWRMRRW